MYKGNKNQNMNALHQTNLKEIPLDLLSALPETQEVALIVSKTKKKIGRSCAKLPKEKYSYLE
jgi:hypothetical protein